MKKHFVAVHEGKKPHKCPICHYGTANKGHLKKHIESVHEGKKPHKCSICDYNTSDKGNLKRHIGTVHAGKEPYKLMKAPLKTRAKFVDDESDLSDNNYVAGPSEPGVYGLQLFSQIVTGIEAQTTLQKGLGLL